MGGEGRRLSEQSSFSFSAVAMVFMRRTFSCVTPAYHFCRLLGDSANVYIIISTSFKLRRYFSGLLTRGMRLATGSGDNAPSFARRRQQISDGLSSRRDYMGHCHKTPANGNCGDESLRRAVNSRIHASIIYLVVGTFALVTASVTMRLGT